MNDLWVGDVAHGPRVAGRKALLFAFLDDHSRLVVGHRWGRHEDVLRLEAALRRGLASRGVPKRIYVDNGSPFVSHQLQRVCAVLGIRLVHSRPGRPQGRGKIERFFATVRAQFLVEIADDQLTSLEELNRLFTAWVEARYHHRPHRETGQAPLVRFTAGGIPEVPGPALLREAFLWAETRTVTKTRWCRCTATTTRSTPPWSAGGSSWCSTRSTSSISRSVTTTASSASRSRTNSARTCIPRPPPSRPTPSTACRPPRRGSTT